MRTTIELPDKLFREVKAKTGRDGMTLKEFVTEAVRDKLNAPKPSGRKKLRRIAFPSIPKSRVAYVPSLTNADVEALLWDEKHTR